MSDKRIVTSAFDSDKCYQSLLTEIKNRLKKAQLRAAIVVNHELIKFYWDTGKRLLSPKSRQNGEISYLKY